MVVSLIKSGQGFILLSDSLDDTEYPVDVALETAIIEADLHEEDLLLPRHIVSAIVSRLVESPITLETIFQTSQGGS